MLPILKVVAKAPALLGCHAQVLSNFLDIAVYTLGIASTQAITTLPAPGLTTIIIKLSIIANVLRTVVNDVHTVAHREGMHIGNRDIPHVRRAGHRAHRHYYRRAAIGFHERLANTQEARRQPTRIRRQP